MRNEKGRSREELIVLYARNQSKKLEVTSGVIFV